jgi:hypothetical protein
MKFKLISRNQKTLINLCDRILFNPIIRSVIFEDDLKVTVDLYKNKLADFAEIIKDLDISAFEDTTIRRCS